MIKIKVNYNIFILLLSATIIFFLKNPLINWLEGDFENIYFIYNTILTANSITPDVVDYPGNSSFSINSLYLKIISFFDKTIIINLKDLTLSNDPVSNFNKIYKYLKFLQLFYSFIALICFYKILVYLNLDRKVALSLSILLLLSNQYLDNIQRYRFDFESFAFYLISTFFLLNALSSKKKILPICISGFFLCMSLFSKIITLPLFLVIPALIYFKKDKSFVRFIKDILVNRDTVILFFMINFLMIFYSIFNSFNIMYLITNNIIYISFYFFYSEYFKSFMDNKKYKYLIFFIIGFLMGIIFMFSQSIDIQKILIVANPYFFFQHHSPNASYYLPNIFLIFKKINFDFLQIFLIFASIFLIVFNKRKKFYLNLFLFLIYFTYKIILSSKGTYLDIFSLIILLIIVSINLQKSKYNLFIYSSLILYFFINSNNLLNNNFNLNIDNNEICELKNFDKKEYNELNKENYFLLYYASKFSNYNFIQKLC